MSRPGRFERLIWTAGGRRCWLCGRLASRQDVTMDHVLPKSCGGSYSLVNLLPAHRACNNARADRCGMELQAFLRALREGRTDEWATRSTESA